MNGLAPTRNQDTAPSEAELLEDIAGILAGKFREYVDGVEGR